jgi:hypothetical protein
MVGVGVLLALVVSRLATLSPAVPTTAGTGAFGVADVSGRDVAARCGGRRRAESLSDGRGETPVGRADAAEVAVSAGKPSRLVESAAATGRTKVDSAAAAPDSVVLRASLPSVPPHETAPVMAKSTAALRSCRDDEVSIALQAVTGRAMVRPSR